MAKHDWKALQAEFLEEHSKTKVAAKEWCEKKGLNYASARRHIKITKGTARVPVNTKVKANVVSATKANMGNFKHGGYAKFFKPEVNAAASDTQLIDELVFCRARIRLVAATIEEIQEQLALKPSLEVAASLYESLFKADQALDRNVARVESITRTLSSIRMDDVNEVKVVAETQRIAAATKALGANTDKAKVQTELTELMVAKERKEQGGTSKLDQYIDELTGGGVDAVVG